MLQKAIPFHRPLLIATVAAIFVITTAIYFWSESESDAIDLVATDDTGRLDQPKPTSAASKMANGRINTEEKATAATETTRLADGNASSFDWTPSRGLTNAVLNRRVEFNYFALDVYEQGLDQTRESDINQALLENMIRDTVRSIPIDGTLFCSSTICLYDLRGEAEIARQVLREFHLQIANISGFQNDVAYIRQDKQLFRFYFITDDFPIAKFYEN